MQPSTLLVQVNPTALQHMNRTRRTGTTDTEVVETAEKRFRASSYVALRSIKCEFHEGVIVLRGRVASYYLKQLAQEMVRNLAGIGAILNVVEVPD